MEIAENIIAYGHVNIQAKHRTTLEITKDNELSKKGDCIVAVSANKAMIELNQNFKNNLCRDGVLLKIIIKSGEISEIINAYGSSRLILSHPTDMVIRKSDFICNRTLAIFADKASCDLSRKFVEKIQKPKQNIEIKLILEA